MHYLINLFIFWNLYALLNAKENNFPAGASNYKEQQQNIYDTVCKSHGQGPRVYFCVKLFELVDIYGGAEMNVTKIHN